MNLVKKKEFVAAALDLEDRTFVVYVVSSVSFKNIYLFCKIPIALLKTNKTPTTVFLKYFNFADVFSPKLVAKLSEYIEINNHTINLVDGKKPSYRPIYNLKPMELDILNIYIETNLVNGFIRFFKSLTSTPILIV